MPGILLPPADEPIVVPMRDGDLRLWTHAFRPAESSRLFAGLRRGIDWATEEIFMFGRPRLVPRLVAWHGAPGAVYTYSGALHEPRPWTTELKIVRERVEQLCGASFNSVLLNLYRDGRDGMGWHADDERELGRNPVIASVSFGAPRRFRLRHRGNSGEPVTVPLTDGSLLLMAGATQHHWLHAVPKTAAAVGERINLTFRRVLG
jgi:alkylated DNA repair dioxygenase AlkB